MKKYVIHSLLCFLCLFMISLTADAQASRKSGERKTEVVTGKKESSRTDREDAKVSRKRAPGRTSGDDRVSTRSDRGGGVILDRRDRTEQSKRRTGGDDRYEHRRDRDRDYGYKGKANKSKAKCGVHGCQHPGKHTGLHKKQSRVRPIRFGHH